MKVKNKTILLTGSTGGIGYCLAELLVKNGAQLIILGKDKARLKLQAEDLGSKSFYPINTIEVNLNRPNAVDEVKKQLDDLGVKIDILINNAGIMDFTSITEQSVNRIAEMIHINSVIPIQLSRRLLPDILESNSGQIVFIGSILGSIGLPYHATYSASKFALRGFAQALRREIASKNIYVTYIAPRAVNTALNNPNAQEMLKATGSKIDDPEDVAFAILKAIEQNRDEVYVGQPESFFARLNALFPSIVSFGLKKQTRTAYEYLHKKGTSYV